MLSSPEFWVAVAFFVTLGVLYRLKVHDQLTAALDKRAERIRAELTEAETLREEAQAALASYREKQRQALSEAETIVARAKAEAARHAERAKVELDAAIQRRQTAAEERIAQAEAKAVADVRAAAVDVAIGAARRILRDTLDDTRRTALLDDAIAALPARLH